MKEMTKKNISSLSRIVQSGYPN